MFQCADSSVGFTLHMLSFSFRGVGGGRGGDELDQSFGSCNIFTALANSSAHLSIFCGGFIILHVLCAVSVGSRTTDS